MVGEWEVLASTEGSLTSTNEVTVSGYTAHDMLKLVVKGKEVKIATEGSGRGSIIAQYNLDDTKSNYRLMDSTSDFDGINCVELPVDGSAVDFSGGLESVGSAGAKKTYRGQFVACGTDGNNVADSTLILNQAYTDATNNIVSISFKFGSTTTVLSSGTSADSISIKLLGMDLPS